MPAWLISRHTDRQRFNHAAYMNISASWANNRYGY